MITKLSGTMASVLSAFPPSRAKHAMTGLFERWLRWPWLVRWGAWILGAFTLLFVRWPQALLQPAFYFEDGQTFFLATYFGSPLETIFRPYVGYLHMVPRLVAYLERLVPVADAPLVAACVVLLITAAIAAYIASDRMSALIPSRALRWILAVVFLLMTAHDEIGTIHNVQWYLAVFLFCASLAGPARSRLAAWAERVILMIVSLTGPFSIVMAPIFIARALRNRSRDLRWSAVIVSGAAAVQLMFILIAHRSQQWPYAPADLAGILNARMIAEPILGPGLYSRLTSLQLPLPIELLGSVALIAIVLAAVSRLPRRPVLAAAYTGGAIAVLGMMSNQVQASAMLGPWEGERYFVPWSMLMAAVLICAAVTGTRWRGTRLLALAGIALLSAGLIANFQIAPWPVPNWAVDSRCIGGEAPCKVPMPGAGEFLRWPGLHGQYKQDLVP